jgi:hypothetical protein
VRIARWCCEGGYGGRCWWVIRAAVDGVGAMQHAYVKKCRILEDLSLRISTRSSWSRKGGVCPSMGRSIGGQR